MSESKNIHLLLVDDDEEFRGTIARWFERKGMLVNEASTGEQALEQAERRDFDVVIADMKIPGMSGIELLKTFKEGNTKCEIILLTLEGSIETGVEAMKAGAFDSITKPFPPKKLETLVRRAHAHGRLRRENRSLKALLDHSQPRTNLVGRSRAMTELFRLIERAGLSEKAILIQGESGTGKELVARALHNASQRAEKPLVTVNCAALPEFLLDSELFGHEKGAFTGAVQSKQGLFEVAEGGTLFIDEIDEMPGKLQAKLLRVLEDGVIRRVGSIKERRVDVRLLGATNRNLVQEVERGHFREDLYYRINAMSLELPPIREREGDVPLLVAHFLGPNWEIEEEAMNAMQCYTWPGNVRQLSNAVERGKILADNNLIRVHDLPSEVLNGRQTETRKTVESPDDLASIERAKIVEILRRESGNKTRAARALRIDRRKLYRLVEKYGISDFELGEPAK